MILKLEIQTFEKMALKDGGTLFKATLIDKSKPSDSRCSTPMTMFIGEMARTRLPDGDPVDSTVEVIVRKITSNNGDVQVKGEIIETKTTVSSPAKSPSK